MSLARLVEKRTHQVPGHKLHSYFSASLKGTHAPTREAQRIRAFFRSPKRLFANREWQPSPVCKKRRAL